MVNGAFFAVFARVSCFTFNKWRVTAGEWNLFFTFGKGKKKRAKTEKKTNKIHIHPNGDAYWLNGAPNCVPQSHCKVFAWCSRFPNERTEWMGRETERTHIRFIRVREQCEGLDGKKVFTILIFHLFGDKITKAPVALQKIFFSIFFHPFSFSFPLSFVFVFYSVRFSFSSFAFRIQKLTTKKVCVDNMLFSGGIHWIWTLCKLVIKVCYDDDDDDGGDIFCIVYLFTVILDLLILKYYRIEHKSNSNQC